MTTKGFIPLRCGTRIAVAFGVLWTSQIANAADLDSAIQPPPAGVDALPDAQAGGNTSLFDPRRMEVRFGGFAHGLGSAEKNTADVSLEIVSPRLMPDISGWWSFLIPRAYVGGMLNVEGRTSSLRGGALWTIPFTERWFGEIFFGGAVHDGSINGTSDLNALGSRALFNVGGSVGYRFDAHWSVLATFDHMSNGKSVFDLPFVHNQGVNSYGIRTAFAF